MVDYTSPRRRWLPKPDNYHPGIFNDLHTQVGLYFALSQLQDAPRKRDRGKTVEVHLCVLIVNSSLINPQFWRVFPQL